MPFPSMERGGGLFVNWAAIGVDVMVKPPGLGMPGTWTSSHCPGRNCVDVKDGGF